MTNETTCSLASSTEEAAQIIICVASSFSWASLIGPIVLGVSTVVAVIGLVSARKIARTKATLDLIEKVESTPHYRSLQSTFKYYKNNAHFSRLVNPEDDRERQDRAAVQDFLSHYELVSIGIEAKILDEKFYRDWMQTPFVRDWNCATEFVQRERWKWNDKTAEWEYYGRLFEAYQRVAKRFSDEAITLDEKYSPPPDAPSGPGDKQMPDVKVD